MAGRARPQPLLTFPPASESRLTQSFPLAPSRFSTVVTHLPLVFIGSVIAYSFYAYFASLVISYLLLTQHSHFKGFLYAAVYLWFAAGCSSAVATAYWRSGGDVPHARGRKVNDLESGVRRPLEDERAGFVIEDEEGDDAEDEEVVDEAEGLLRRQAAEDAEDLRLERLEQAREMREKRGKMVARSATTRRDDRGGGGGGFDMLAALKDLEGPPEGATRDEEWGSPRMEGSVQVKGDGRARFCRKCQVDKPDRTHHCSSCEKCVLKMDHHCPWLGGACVGYRNYKAFLLFLWYGGALGIFVGVTTVFELMNFVEEAPELLGFIFGICMALFGAYHLYLACNNRTTLETMERASYAVLPPSPGNSSRPRYKSDDALTRTERRKLKRAADKYNVYDLGVKANLAQIFGGWERKWSWALPCWDGGPPGNGTTFPLDREKLRKLREVTTQIRLQAQSGSTSDSSSD
ncbi:hypothetical protein RQP46_001440 [Phenoliferia psychrophenolica]